MTWTMDVLQMSLEQSFKLFKVNVGLLQSKQLRPGGRMLILVRRECTVCRWQAHRQRLTDGQSTSTSCCYLHQRRRTNCCNIHYTEIRLSLLNVIFTTDNSKAFSVSSVRNSLSHNCWSAELLSISKHACSWKLNCSVKKKVKYP